MDLPAKAVFEILKGKGVKTVHHANTVITACQFLRNGALISRGTIERRQFYQTPQSSDQLDKEFGLWFDVFTDSVDIHERASKRNAYGPVLFVLDCASLSKSYTGRIWVTKLNPTKWKGTTRQQRWFESTDELEKSFVRGRFDQMIVFRHSGGELPLAGFLKQIVLDDPQRATGTSQIDFYSMAYGALRLAKTEGNLNVPIRKRECPSGCRCKAEYDANVERTKDMFIPRA